MKKTIAYLLLVGISYLTSGQSIYTLIDAAEESLEKNHWERATKEFKSILEGNIDDLTYLQRANVYNHLGYLSLQLLDPFEAERYLNLSILYHEESGIPDEKDYADALLNMGMLYLNQVEFDLSRRYMQKSLKILERLPKHRADYWIARSKLALLYEEAGSTTLALSIYNESYDQLVASGNDLTPDFAEICMHKGRILIQTGKPADGEKFINLSSTIYESLGKEFAVQQAESLESLAVFYERMGRYGEAEETLLEVLRLKRAIPDEADILIIETLNDLGIMYHQIGRYEQAKEMFREVVEECEENVGTDHPFYATAKNNLGTLALAEDNVNEARDMFNDALTTYKAKFGTSHPYYANTLNNLARVERKLGNMSLAEKYYMEVLKIDEKIYGKNHPDYATTLINVGVLYSAIGREEEAADYYKEAVEIRERVLGENHPAFGMALEYMAMHYLAMDNLMECELYFRKSIEIQISRINTLFPIMTEQERQIFYQNIKSNVDRYNYVASELLDKKPELVESIFKFQTNTKDILFSTSHKVRSQVIESSDYELKELYAKWQSDKRLLASYYQMGLQELEELNINLPFEESRVEQIEHKLASKLETFPNSLHPTDLTCGKVLELIKDKDPVVEIVKLKEFKSLTKTEGTLFGFTDYTRYLAIIFMPDSDKPTHVFLGDDYKTDDQHFQNYITEIESVSAYEKFWEPVDKQFNNSSFVKLIPDGIFNKININSLQQRNGKYIIDKYYVSHLTNARDLLTENASVFNKKSYLFGDPDFEKDGVTNIIDLNALEGSQKEVEKVSDVLSPSSWNVKTYVDSDANELRIRSAYNPTILHIASHSFYQDPLNFISSSGPITHPFFRSGIYLSGASVTFSRYTKGVSTIPENDGVLTAYEAMNLDLSRTQLVVLSAADVELDVVENIDGIYGLHRAFVVAGARNLITSLARINEDASRELMILFYEKFVETNAVDESLKFAQLKLREKYSDPKIWGAFIHTGNG